ncbi:hypothetical protein IE53DRAFT_390029 [Violaceomyces palustris]|uniref:Uncharacterized protein n=1 Tax=Violaceomyces palustris TaxID=1673888 RepID=A0ACD0NPZ2_9BASI|nr:hypothetical protein IE53DRAFT_390029 [Violaceomyces palustris]
MKEVQIETDFKSRLGAKEEEKEREDGRHLSDPSEKGFPLPPRPAVDSLASELHRPTLGSLFFFLFFSFHSRVNVRLGTTR